MNLDDNFYLPKGDSPDMYSHIVALPDHLKYAWELGQKSPLENPLKKPQNILIASVGGAAVGADLIAAYAAPLCQVPIHVLREYDLPAWAKNPSTLLVAFSNSGNAQETLSAFEQAHKSGCRLLAISTGGKLLEMARSFGVPAWSYEYNGQSRAAVGFTFGLLLALLSRLKVIPDPAAQVEQTIQTLRQQQESLLLEIPLSGNPAKRLAGQLCGRLVTIIASDYLAPVARRWKGQFNENAKAWAQFEFLPEADHNTLAGTQNPPVLMEKIAAVFLQADSDNPQNRLRSELTREEFMVEGINTDFFKASGVFPMLQMLSAVQFGDFVSFYLAMIYGVDPTHNPASNDLEKTMSSRPNDHS